MQHGFFQKLFLTLILAFSAACLFWLFRHIIEQAFLETGVGWKQGLRTKRFPLGP